MRGSASPRCDELRLQFAVEEQTQLAGVPWRMASSVLQHLLAVEVLSPAGHEARPERRVLNRRQRFARVTSDIHEGGSVRGHVNEMLGIGEAALRLHATGMIRDVAHVPVT